MTKKDHDHGLQRWKGRFSAMIVVVGEEGSRGCKSRWAEINDTPTPAKMSDNIKTESITNM